MFQDVFKKLPGWELGLCCEVGVNALDSREAGGVILLCRYIKLMLGL